VHGRAGSAGNTRKPAADSDVIGEPAGAGDEANILLAANCLADTELSKPSSFLIVAGSRWKRAWPMPRA
jgi:hypothetical protein